MALLSYKSRAAEIRRGLVCDLDLSSRIAVAKQGGTITGSGAFDGRRGFVAAADAWVNYGKPIQCLGGATKATFMLEDVVIPSSLSTSRFFLTNYGTTGWVIYICVSGYDATNVLRLEFSGGRIAEMPITPGAFYRNITITFDNTATPKVAGYANGAALTVTPRGNPFVPIPASDGNLEVGSYNGGSLKMTSGSIGRIRIWSGAALSQAEVQAYTEGSMWLYERQAARWPMKMKHHNPTAGQTEDESFYGKPMVFGAGAATPTKLQSRGYSADGGDYAQSGNLFASANRLTMAVHMKAIYVGGNNCAVLDYESANLAKVGGILYLTPTLFQFYCGTAAATGAANAPFSAAMSGLRFVMVGTYNGTNTSMWLNGIKATDAAVAIAPDVDSSVIASLFCRGNLTAKAFNGIESYQALIAPAALNETQVLDLTIKWMRSMGEV